MSKIIVENTFKVDFRRDVIKGKTFAPFSRKKQDVITYLTDIMT
jgi:hypothetical protein